MKKHVANMLTEYIILREEKKIVRKIIGRHYSYYTEDERKIIYERTLDLLSGTNDVILDFGMTTRWTKILEQIIAYLDTHHELVLEGFINFRLKEYREKLVQTVDKAVDDFTMDLEYKEFIRVLRCFVDIQAPQLEEVHVVIVNSSMYKIVDNHGQMINNQSFENFIMQKEDHINYEDMLITSLITIAPYSVMVHVHESNNATIQNVVETIKNIFDGRVMICHGCDFCY